MWNVLNLHREPVQVSAWRNVLGAPEAHSPGRSGAEDPMRRDLWIGARGGHSDRNGKERSETMGMLFGKGGINALWLCISVMVWGAPNKRGRLLLWSWNETGHKAGCCVPINVEVGFKSLPEGPMPGWWCPGRGVSVWGSQQELYQNYFCSVIITQSK